MLGLLIIGRLRLLLVEENQVASTDLQVAYPVVHNGRYGDTDESSRETAKSIQIARVESCELRVERRVAVMLKIYRPFLQF